MELILRFLAKTPLAAFEGEDVGGFHPDDAEEVLGVGNAVGHFQPIAQATGPQAAEFRDAGKGVHAAKHGSDDHDENLSEVVQLVAAGAWVFEEEEIGDAGGKAARPAGILGIAGHPEQGAEDQTFMPRSAGTPWLGRRAPPARPMGGE